MSIDSGVRTVARLMAATAIAVPLVVSAAHANEAGAKEIFKKMSDYVSAQTAISFRYDSNLDVVSADSMVIGLSSSGAIEINRPNMIKATRTGGFADIEAVFDGKTFSVLGKNVNLYAQVEIPGSIDNLVDVLRDKFGRPLPAADLLLANPYEAIMPSVTDVKYLGVGVILGRECNHIALRTEDVDVQLWVAAGEEPYPCRYTLTSRKVEGMPQYSIDVRDWKAGAPANPSDFTFEPPKDAKQVKPEEITDADELPSAYIPAK